MLSKDIVILITLSCLLKNLLEPCLYAGQSRSILPYLFTYWTDERLFLNLNKAQQLKFPNWTLLTLIFFISCPLKLSMSVSVSLFMSVSLSLSVCVLITPFFPLSFCSWACQFLSLSLSLFVCLSVAFRLCPWRCPCSCVNWQRKTLTLIYCMKNQQITFKVTFVVIEQLTAAKTQGMTGNG